MVSQRKPSAWRFSTAARTARAASITSTPMPSPGITAIRNVLSFIVSLNLAFPVAATLAQRHSSMKGGGDAELSVRRRLVDAVVPVHVVLAAPGRGRLLLLHLVRARRRP